MTTIHEVQPGDCFARAKRLEGEVELIRKELGKPQDGRPRPTVTGAAPRECYFAALALFRKADRVCFEVTGDAMAPVPHTPPLVELKPGHVLQILDAALGELTEVKERLGIKESASEPAKDYAKQPSDVLGTIVSVNRQLNLLLERQFVPGDCYQVVALARAYAERLLARFPNAAVPPTPAYERYKVPGDCYDRLHACLRTVRGVIQRSGLTMVDDALPKPPDTLPSDVFDLGSLVLAEVAYLDARLGDLNPPYPFEANAPGRKVPSHVHQVAAHLERILSTLASEVEKNPAWITAK